MPASSFESIPSVRPDNAALASLRRMSGVELAFTLWPEWVWAIANLDKRVENRGWALSPTMIGRRIAIHAGASIGGRKGKVAEQEGLLGVESMARRAGWAAMAHPLDTTVFVKGDITKRLKPSDITTSAIICTAVLASCTKPSAPKGWYTGSYGFELADVHVLPEPIPCAGAQGFWRLP